MRPTSARLHAFVLGAALAALMLGDVASGAHANVKFTGPTNYGTGIRPSAMGSATSTRIRTRPRGRKPQRRPKPRPLDLARRREGTFGAQTGVNANAAPTSIAVADFDGDSHLDLAIASSARGSVAVLLGAGNGTLAPVSSPAGAGPSSVAVGDFNGNGHPDVAVAAPGNRAAHPVLDGVEVHVEFLGGHLVAGAAGQIHPQRLA